MPSSGPDGASMISCWHRRGGGWRYQYWRHTPSRPTAYRAHTTRYWVLQYSSHCRGFKCKLRCSTRAGTHACLVGAYCRHTLQPGSYWQIRETPVCLVQYFIGPGRYWSMDLAVGAYCVHTLQPGPVSANKKLPNRYYRHYRY